MWKKILQKITITFKLHKSGKNHHDKGRYYSGASLWVIINIPVKLMQVIPAFSCCMLLLNPMYNDSTQEH